MHRFHLCNYLRESALAAIAPERLSSLRAAWEQWNASMPEIAQDATVSLVYSDKDMPQR